MYEEIRRRVEGTDNSGLLPGLARCRHPEVTRMLGQVQEAAIGFYLETHQCLNSDAPFITGYFVSEQSGFVKNYWPIVEGYEWYGALQIDVQSGRIILFHPWMSPKQEGGAPDPIVYTTPCVRVEEVLKVVQILKENKLRHINESLDFYRRVTTPRDIAA